MASKESVNTREYYRQQFDSTYLPIIYHLLNQLQQQAEFFQNVNDPIYDKFLKDVHCLLTDVNDECVEANTSVDLSLRRQLKKKKKICINFSNDLWEQESICIL